MQVASTIIWKNQALATYYESETDSYYVELFMGAKRGIVNFAVIRSFDEKVLAKLGYQGNQMYECVANKNRIDPSKRADAVRLFTEELTEKDPVTGHYINYVERNNYYRMLTGLPPIEDTERDFVYITEYNTPYPMDIPIHKMMMSTRLQIEKSGYLAKLIAKYPQKKYLKYIGRKGIDIFAARAAERFDLLYCESGNVSFETDFREMYAQNKYVANAVFYSPAFNKTNELYENFLAMSILFMTLEQMHHKYLNADTTRDFYDVESIKYIYDSYGVPFFSEIPLQYHTKIVKQINRLMANKGSSTVFFDLFNLFDSQGMTIYAYYLTKTHRFVDGKPIFPKKEDGSLDERAMYDVAFSKVELYKDPALETSDPTNRLAFPDLTYSDPYWVNDKDLFDKIYAAGFNYTESKYIGLQVVLDILGTTYQNAYFFKMLQDNSVAMEKISLRWSATNAYVSLFDFFVYMASLYCRKYGYTGELTDELAFTATVLGYDFRQHVEHFRDIIAKDPILKKDIELVKLINQMDVSDLQSVNNTFKSIVDLRTLLAQRFSDTHNKKEYETYRAIYQTLLTSENIHDSFLKTDGTMASSYDDLLADTAPGLYQRLLEQTQDTIDVEINLVIREIEKAIPSIRTLDSAFGLDVNALIESLFKMLAFFKSAKAELVGYNVVYWMSLRGVNFFKLMDMIININDYAILPNDRYTMTDIMEVMHEYMNHLDDILNYLTDEMVREHHDLRIDDYILYLKDELIHLMSIILEAYKEDTRMTDFLVSCVTELAIGSLMRIGDNAFILHEEFLEPKYHGLIKDLIHFLTDRIEKVIKPGEIDATYKSLVELSDFIESIYDEVRSYKLTMNVRSLFPKDRLSELMWRLIGCDEWLLIFVKQIIGHIESGYETHLVTRDRFIIRILYDILPEDRLLVFDTLLGSVGTGEFVDRVRLRDSIQRGMSCYEETFLSYLYWYRDKLSVKMTECSDLGLHREGLIPSDFINAHREFSNGFFDKQPFGDYLRDELLRNYDTEAVQSSFRFGDKSDFPITESLGYQSTSLTILDFMPNGRLWSESLLYTTTRLKDRLMVGYINSIEAKKMRQNLILIEELRRGHNDAKLNDSEPYWEYFLELDDWLRCELEKVSLKPEIRVFHDRLREVSTTVEEDGN